MKRTSLSEFTQFVKEHLRYNQLAYHYLYEAYDAKSNFERKKLKDFYDLVKIALIMDSERGEPD